MPTRQKAAETVLVRPRLGRRPQAQAEAVARATSFDAMRAVEKRGDMHFRVNPHSEERLRGDKADDPTKLNRVMTRAGLAGGFKRELNATAQDACLAEMEQLAPALRARYLPTYTARARGARAR